MALTQFTTDISYISKLPDSPTPNGGYTKETLKAEYDKAGNALKTFVNNTMIAEIQAELNAKASSTNFYNKNDLNSTVEGSSGADKIGVTAISGLNGTTAQEVLKSVGESLAENEQQLNDVWYNIKNAVGATDKDKLQNALNEGHLNIIVPNDIIIDTLIVDKRYQRIRFQGNITITGDGIQLKNSNIRIEARYIVGNTVVISSGALSPIPTVKCGFDVRGAFANIYFDLLEGFNVGILFDDTMNGTENLFEGIVQKCNTGVALKNTTGGARHEGNTFDLHVFQCYKGIDIDVNCKYQNINKVIDNAQITDSLDIDDRSGNHIIKPYFVRLANCNLAANSIVFNVNGSGYMQIGNNTNGTIVNQGNIELCSSTPYIDIKDSLSDDYDFRLIKATTEASEEAFNIIPFGNGTAINFLKTGYVAFPKRKESDMGKNFTSISLPSGTSPNTMFFAKNTGDGNKTRLYVYSSGWKYIEIPERTISSDSSAPTSGTWNVGDRVNNNNPSYVKNISHWTCVAGGTTGGTWTAHGCGGGTTANRPSLTLNDLGYLYYDTDLNKLIRWSGGAWQIPS